MEKPLPVHMRWTRANIFGEAIRTRSFKIGDALEIGPTGNNLRDLRILLTD
jgi:hypothetical protein